MSPEKKPAAAESMSDREIIITRDFQARRELVWEAWTDPRQVVKWWGPKGFSTTIETMDVRPGSVWKHVMRGPDGTNYPNKSVFKEVVRPEKIVYTHAGGREDGQGISFTCTWTFAQIDAETTRVTIHQVFTTAEMRERVVKEFNAIEGGRQTLGRLAEHLLGEATTQPPSRRLRIELSADRELVATRTFRAPRELVFRAYTDPAAIPRWWGPRSHVTRVDRMEVKAGGAWRFESTDPRGHVHAFRGTYQEIIAPEKIAWTFEYEGAPGQVSLETVRFEQKGEETIVTTTVRYETPQQRKAVLDSGMEWGFNQSMERLEETLPRAGGVQPFEIERVFDASRELLFELWTNPEHLVKWFSPKGCTTRYESADIREGGLAHFCMATPDGTEYWGKVEYRELDRPNRLVYLQWFSNREGSLSRHPADPNWPREKLTVIRFEDAGAGQTRLRLEWWPIGASAEELSAFDRGRSGMRDGWSGTFDQLAGYLRESGK